MAKSLKFTIEVEGLDLPEKAQAEISKALNQTLMHKLGELNMANGGGTSTAKDAPEAKAGGSIFVLKDMINGGRLLQAISPELSSAIRQFETKNNIPATKGAVNIQMNQ